MYMKLMDYTCSYGVAENLKKLLLFYGQLDGECVEGVLLGEFTL